MRNVAVLDNMGVIFGLWILWRMKNLLEQIRRNQLTPAERAVEEVARDEKDSARSFTVLLILFILACAFIGGMNANH
jgi:hypothetical protein